MKKLYSEAGRGRCVCDSYEPNICWEVILPPFIDFIYFFLCRQSLGVFW